MPLTRIDSAFLDLGNLGGIIFDEQESVPTFKVDASTHRVGIGHSAPVYKLDIVGDTNISSGSNYLVGGSQISTANVTEHSSYLYYTDARARNSISITDSGGDGSLSYNSSTGVITYTGPSAADVRAHFSAGAGISITSGSVAVVNSIGLTGTPTAPTAAAGTNTTQIATTAFVSTGLANLVDSAPGALDTLNELAAALGDDANFSTTITNSIATKLSKSGGQMTGNITFSGSQTVDGRDLSVDGAKLDGIESNATADQTAAEILTAIKTVDGSGSGLDADLLDGINSGSFLRSDANDTATGSITFSANTNISNESYIGYSATYNYKPRITGGIGTRSEVISAANLLLHADIDGSGTAEFLSIRAGGGTANELKIASKTVAAGQSSSALTYNGGQVWHAGNDGSGSGLDADTLDGVQASSFLRSDAADTFSGDLTSSGSARILLKKTDNNVSDHIQFYNGTTRMGEIGCQDTTWLRINQVTEKNIYTPRYIRADAGFFVDGTAKGINGSGNFFGGTIAGASDYGTLLRSNTSDTFSGGTLTVDGGSGLGLKVESADFAEQIEIHRNHASNAPAIKFSNDTAQCGILYAANDGILIWRDGTTSNSNTVWHAGNDGSGSGLDADTVDGVNSGSFLRSDANDSFSGALTSTARNNGIFGTYDSTKTHHIWSMGTAYKNAADGSDFGNLYGLAYKHATNTTGGTMGGGHMMVWVKNGTPYGAIGTDCVYHTTAMKVGSNTVWHAGNDGSGSGLDADTLDGQQGSYYAPLASPTFTGDLTIPGKIIHSGDTDTYIQFDANNKFRVVCEGGEVQEWGNNYTLINDNDQLRLGSGSDFRMYFSGADTYFRNYAHANGDIIFQGENSAGSNQNIFMMKTDGTRTYNILYENSAERFRTNSTGVKVTGIMESTESVTLGGELNLIGTSDANKYIDCRVGTNALSIRKTTGGDSGHENMARFVGGGGVELYYNNVKKFETTSTGATLDDTLTISGDSNQILLHPGTTNETVIVRNDGTNMYFLLSAAGASPSGTWNTLRPLYINTGTGMLHSNNGQDFAGGMSTSNITLDPSGILNHNDTDSYDKIRVWTSSSYTIGMKSAQTHGDLNDYAMTFTMNDEADRGWLWRDTSHTASGGAMSLSTRGSLAVSRGINTGGGETDTGWSDHPLHVINSWQTGQNDSYNTVYIDANWSGTAAFSANRTQVGLRVDQDNSKSNTTSTSGNRHTTIAIHSSSDSAQYTHDNRGLYSFAKSSGAGDGIGTQTVHGAYTYAQGYLTSGAANIYGLYSLAYRGGSTSGGTLYGVHGKALSTTNGSGKSGNAVGGYFEVECDEDTIADAKGVFSHIDRDGGTVTTGYLYYGSYAGTVGTKFGAYITGEAKNYFSGNVGIGSTDPVTKLDVNGDIHCTKLSAGTAANPGTNVDICLGADSDTGFACPSDGNLKFWCNNAEVASWTSSTLTFVKASTFSGRVSIRGHLDLSDGENLDFGSSDDVRISYNSNNWLYTNFITGNGIVYQDNGVDKIILEDSGVIRPSVTNTGTIGTSSRYWDNGYFQDFNVSGTLNVRGAIDLADSDILRLGSGDDAELFCNGSHLYLDLNSGIGNFYIRDGSTTRYTFNDNGSFTATGNITAYSDIKLKDNIETISNPLDKINQINGVTFDRIDTPELGRQMGVIAQDVEKVCPELVSTDDEGTKSVAYGNMVGLLIEAIKDQQKQIDELKAQLENN